MHNKLRPASRAERVGRTKRRRGSCPQAPHQYADAVRQIVGDIGPDGTGQAAAVTPGGGTNEGRAEQ
ncbi:hypothetical protein [Nocardia miyunensis]|uniref:hypothetical protein n=1 Tax=Nocardia miyunensis TaxID=282684 RepID=UPI0012F5124B|nr:hypothetical protein [Nocardia miyunensis]